MRLLPSLLLCSAASGPRRAQSVQLLVQSSPLAGFRYGEARRGLAAAAARATRSSWCASRTIRTTRTRCASNGAAASSATCRGAQNAALAWGLERGTPLRARVSRLAEHPNPARRIEFEVYIE